MEIINYHSTLSCPLLSLSLPSQCSASLSYSYPPVNKGKERREIEVQFSSVAQSCPTLCDPMNHSTPVLPVHHQLPEFTQIHVHQISLLSLCNTQENTFYPSGNGLSLLFQFSSVAQLCPTLCDPMNCSTPGLPIHHHLPEFTQTHVH